jgi:hypothetical protein
MTKRQMDTTFFLCVFYTTRLNLLNSEIVIYSETLRHYFLK